MVKMYQVILDIVWELFLRNGYDVISMCDIVNVIGIMQFVFYYYFKDKEVIFLVVIMMVGVEIRVGIEVI